ncbi:MBL fold metallo-hydrolase [Streptomyces alkaliphilus]|uniref:MBL fold metallo-hydrolase n=1 Tax=Streptomyces alkaliphilus TaxID=1472722 RepID=A0A7W3TEA7_9ACTN|nr:MBL fold metallo-hydrolase [Streptomyces alkaliphilus]MBB0245269.1 MBL fold metallo-hydrolase [Streptomyces alkaliphilus]MQS06356.1 MBL fold metallo-hydrolase [Streptomyces alkaliphilus]
MKLTVVGCSGSFPSADSACSCYLIEAEGYRLLLDLGNGALGELQKYTGLYDIDAIVLSHLHPDHFIDMCGYFVARYYRHEGGRCAPIPVYGPAGTEHRLNTAYEDTPTEKSMSEVFDFRTLHHGESLKLGPLAIDVSRVRHPVEAYGFRVEHEGRVLTYSGDTGPCREVEDLARDADLFLCEAAFTDGKENLPDIHMTGREAGESARAAGVRRLVLTHIPPWTDTEVNLRDARAVFDGPVEAARPGAVHTF